MANYLATSRTNYFRTENAELLRETIAAAAYDVEGLRLWEQTGEDGIIRYAFGCYTSIGGSMDEDAFEEFVAKLQACLPDDDAIVITEIGNEKLRYLEALATIITQTGYDTVDLTEAGYEKASEVLGYPNWSTKENY